MTIASFKRKTYPTYQLGDDGPGGGVVFLTPSSNGNPTGQYFEVATSVFSRASGIRFVEQSSRPAGLNLLSGIGAGKRNTRILNESFPNSVDTCLSFVKNFRQNNLSDWYVPSKDEMNAIIDFRPPNIPNNYSVVVGSGGLSISYRIPIGSGGSALGLGKWATSSQVSNSNTLLHSYTIDLYNDGFFSKNQDDADFYVMPIRSFYPYGV